MTALNWVILLGLVAVSGVCAAPAQAQQSPSGPVARLEVWRHSRLAETRAHDTAALAPFTTDGCSGGMSSAWQSMAAVFPEFAVTYDAAPPWESCCVTHDRDYHLAGYDATPEASFTARLRSDVALRMCVNQIARDQSETLSIRYDLPAADISLGFGFVADRMFEAVRLGGAPCSGLPWRWGYGWPQCW